MACFLIIASTPQNNWQSRLGFTVTEWPGVYKGTEILSQRVHIILLNKLANTAYNAPIKVFAKQRKERDKALVTTRDSGLPRLSKQIDEILMGLRRIYMSNVASPSELTPDLIMEIGREWIDFIIKLTPLNEILLYHKSDEVLSHYNE